MEEKLDKVIRLLERLVENSSHSAQFAYWSLEQETYLLEKWDEGLGAYDIALALADKFGTSRSSSAILSRYKQLRPTSLAKPVTTGFKKKATDTEDTKAILNSIYDNPPF